MVRINVHVTTTQLIRLNKLSDKTGLSRAEIIRRAIDEYLEKHESKKDANGRDT